MTQAEQSAESVRYCVDCGAPFTDGDEATLLCADCGCWADDDDG